MTIVGGAVRITHFKVPKSYIIENEENPGTLTLECEYTYEPSETGVAVSWRLHDKGIFQWIPQKKTHPTTVSINRKRR